MPVPDPSLLTPADPDRVVDVREAAGALPIRPNHEWNLAHYPDHPGGWFPATLKKGEAPDADVGTWVLPLLQRERAVPGLRGHRTIPRGEDPRNGSSSALQRIRDAGGTVLLNRVWRFAVPLDARDPQTGRTGHYWASVWETPRKAIRNQRQLFTFDRVRYLRWLLALMRAGEIAPPDPEVVRDHVTRKRARIERREALSDLDPKVRAAYVAAARKDLELLLVARNPTDGEPLGLDDGGEDT